MVDDHRDLEWQEIALVQDDKDHNEHQTLQPEIISKH
jgi:hypothetical protein